MQQYACSYYCMCCFCFHHRNSTTFYWPVLYSSEEKQERRHSYSTGAMKTKQNCFVGDVTWYTLCTCEMVWHETLVYTSFCCWVPTKLPVVIQSRATLPHLGAGLQCTLILPKLTQDWIVLQTPRRLDCFQDDDCHQHPQVVYTGARYSVCWQGNRKWK